MEASDICPGLPIIFSAVISTVFNSNDGQHSMKMNAEDRQFSFQNDQILLCVN